MMKNGTSYGIEHIKELCILSEKNISKNYKKTIDNKNVIIINGDGRLGYQDAAPYDCIHVGAASEYIPK